MAAAPRGRPPPGRGRLRGPNPTLMAALRGGRTLPGPFRKGVSQTGPAHTSRIVPPGQHPYALALSRGSGAAGGRPRARVKLSRRSARPRPRRRHRPEGGRRGPDDLHGQQHGGPSRRQPRRRSLPDERRDVHRCGRPSRRRTPSAGADTIIVPAGVYELQIPTVNEDLDTTGDFDIHSPMTIVGAGAGHHDHRRRLPAARGRPDGAGARPALRDPPDSRATSPSAT